jgi:hypothetical protein
VQAVTQIVSEADAELGAGLGDAEFRAEPVACFYSATLAWNSTAVDTRLLLERFHRMLRVHDAKALAPWLAEAKGSLLASFSKGINSDLAAVRAALTETWSSGQTEGQITKLKLEKRQMYGRAGLDLLRARLIGAA